MFFNSRQTSPCVHCQSSSTRFSGLSRMRYMRRFFGCAKLRCTCCGHAWFVVYP